MYNNTADMNIKIKNSLKDKVNNLKDKVNNLNATSDKKVMEIPVLLSIMIMRLKDTYRKQKYNNDKERIFNA